MLLYYRQFITFVQSHYWMERSIPTDDTENLPGDQLPPGATPPLWVNVPEGSSQRDILEKISQLPEMTNLSTTVIYYDDDDKDEGAEEFCQEKEWNYRGLDDMAGSEDECVIVLNNLELESISRPHNLLVVVTIAGHK